MNCNILVLLAATALLLSPQIALADGDGATTGLVGGAVAGVGVGDPVGAVVGGAADGVATGPHRETVVAQPVAPCRSATTQTTDNSGAGGAAQTTHCPN